MCGRFFLVSPARQVAEAFGLSLAEPALEGYRPRYNIAPTQAILAIVHQNGAGRLMHAHWGITPSWAARSSEPVKPLINARAETVADKPVFRKAFEQHRCIIPADGFYEWLATNQRTRRPHVIQLPGRAKFLPLAGIISNDCVAILTRAAVGPMTSIHERMPLLVPESDFDAWLSPTTRDPQSVLARALAHTAAAPIENYEVGPAVSKATTDDPSLIIPLKDLPQQDPPAIEPALKPAPKPTRQPSKPTKDPKPSAPEQLGLFG